MVALPHKHNQTSTAARECASASAIKAVSATSCRFGPRRLSKNQPNPIWLRARGNGQLATPLVYNSLHFNRHSPLLLGGIFLGSSTWHPNQTRCERGTFRKKKLRKRSGKQLAQTLCPTAHVTWQIYQRYQSRSVMTTLFHNAHPNCKRPCKFTSDALVLSKASLGFDFSWKL